MKGDQGVPNLPGADTGLSPRQRLAGTDLLPAFDAIETLLAAASGRSPSDPVAAAYLAGVRVQGERLAAIGGTEAMRTVLDLVTACEPRAAYARHTFIAAAWAGLPGWKS